jgi:PadR family transcriptional regulator, regulatory protein AphA
LTHSHVYPELDRLCGCGLLDVTEVEQERFPTKRVYEITESGVEVLEGWLDDSAMPPERQRNLFLVRLFFGDRMSSGQIEELLSSDEQAQRARRDLLAELVERLAQRPESTYRRAPAMLGLAQAQAKPEWIGQVRPVLLHARCAEPDRC